MGRIGSTPSDAPDDGPIVLDLTDAALSTLEPSGYVVDWQIDTVRSDDADDAHDAGGVAVSAS